jgi:hypothetical protein
VVNQVTTSDGLAEEARFNPCLFCLPLERSRIDSDASCFESGAIHLALLLAADVAPRLMVCILFSGFDALPGQLRAYWTGRMFDGSSRFLVTAEQVRSFVCWSISAECLRIQRFNLRGDLLPLNIAFLNAFFTSINRFSIADGFRF